jgi:hypothetical protein
MSKRQGQLIWQGKQIVWRYSTFRDEHSFELAPHFEITATDERGNSITWPRVTVDLPELKGITDLSKWPQELLYSVLDNVVAKLNEKEPELTRLEVKR